MMSFKLFAFSSHERLGTRGKTAHQPLTRTDSVFWSCQPVEWSRNVKMVDCCVFFHDVVVLCVLLVVAHSILTIRMMRMHRSKALREYDQIELSDVIVVAIVFEISCNEAVPSWSVLLTAAQKQQATRQPKQFNCWYCYLGDLTDRLSSWVPLP